MNPSASILLAAAATLILGVAALRLIPAVRAEAESAGPRTPAPTR